jgi:hypothetical protein
MNALVEEIEEVFACTTCSTKLYGETFEGQLSGVTWKNAVIFVDSKDDGFLFCDKHYHGAKRKWTRLIRKHG